MSTRWASRAWGVTLVGMLATGCVFLDDGDDSAGESGAMDGGTLDGADDGGSEVPSSDYCSPVSGWTMQESAFEDEVLVLVNQARGEARSCGGVAFGVAPPLTMEPRLRCAARVHSLDMATRNFFSHDNPDGETPYGRIEQAGYSFRAAGENIAAGQPTAADVVAGWIESPGHCSNIMSQDYVHLGVGYASSETAEFPHYWTQTFGAPL